MSWEGSSAPVWDAERLRIATDAAGVALWSWNVDSDEVAMNEHAYGMWGVPRNGLVTFEILSARIHPADVARVRTAFNTTRTKLGTFEIDFRSVHGDEVRWISARGQGDGVGMVDRNMFGFFRRDQAQAGRGDS